jgi:hypothetical protein
METKFLPTPCVTKWTYTDKSWRDMRRWLDENINGSYQMVAIARNSIVLTSANGKTTSEEVTTSSCEKGYPVVCLFECPRDAMLFKLTWSSDGESA